MTKQELYEKVTEELVALGAKQKFLDVIELYLKPKSGGARVNLEEVVKRDDSGVITHIQCSLSGVWLPATAEYFYEDKSEKGGIDGLKRLSRQAEGVRKKHIKLVSTSEKAILHDVLSGAITNEDGQAKLAELENLVPDYSTVGEFTADETAEVEA